MFEIIEWLYFAIAMIIGFTFYGALAVGISSAFIDFIKEGVSKWTKN